MQSREIETLPFSIENTLSIFKVFDNIGVGRFRILGGQGLEYWGAKV